MTPPRDALVSAGILVLAALLLAAHVVLDEGAQSGLLGNLVSAHTVTWIGFESRGAQGFLSTDTRDAQHVVEGKIPLRARSNYEIRFVAVPLQRDATELRVDLVAPEYDSAPRPRLISVGPSDRPRTLHVRFNAGFAPPEASLRILYSGPPGVEIRDVQVFELPGWFATAYAASLMLGIAMLFLSVVCIIARRGAGRVWQLIHAEPAVAGVIVVAAVYGIAVVVRFVLYMATPFWSGDEYLYKSVALEIFEIGRPGTIKAERVGVPLDLPNLLYPYLLAPTFLLGDWFYPGMRLVNSITMNLAAFPVYFLARRFVRPPVAVSLAVAAIVTPFMNIAAFAVTEVLFYPVFLAFALASVTAVQRQRSVCWQFMVGVLAATLFNIRPNGILLLPAYLFALFWYLLCISEVWDAMKRPVWLVSIAAFAGMHWVIQSLVGGAGASSLGLYGTALDARGLPGPFDVLRHDLMGAINLALGHLLTLAIPYAFPIAVLATGVMLVRKSLCKRRDLQALIVVVATLTATLIATALAFTIKVAPSDMGGLGRWHSRYYFHVYALILVASTALWAELDTAPKRARMAVPAITAMLILLGATTLVFTVVPFNPWFGSIADNMDVQWINSARSLYWLFAATMLIGAALWYTSRRLASARVLICGFATWCVIANVGAMETLRLGTAGQSSSCGSGAARLVSSLNAPYAIFGTSRADVVGIGFWVRRLPQLTKIIPKDSADGLADIALPKVDILVTKGIVGDVVPGRKILDVGGCRAYVLD
jgi:hypothetical protein